MNIERSDNFFSHNDYSQHQLVTKEVIDKPKRPLTAYNFFFQNERKLMLGPDFVAREESIKPKRRVHRRTHGKFSFGEMARIISKKWKLLDETTRSKFEEQAEKDRMRYRQQMNIWKSGSKHLHQQHQNERKLQHHQQHIQKQAAADNDHAHKLSRNIGNRSITFNGVTSRDLPSIFDSERCDQLRVLQQLKRESMIQSNEATGSNLLGSRTHVASSAAALYDALKSLSRNNDGASSSATVPSISASDSDGPLFRNFSTGIDDRILSALTAINSQQLQEARMNEVLVCELLNIQPWEMTSFWGNASRVAAQLRNDCHRLSHTISTTENDRLVHAKSKDLNMLAGTIEPNLPASSWTTTTNKSSFR